MKRPLTGHINCFSEDGDGLYCGPRVAEEVRDTMILGRCVSMDTTEAIQPDFWNAQGYFWLEEIRKAQRGGSRFGGNDDSNVFWTRFVSRSWFSDFDGVCF